MVQTTVNRVAVSCPPEKAFDYVADFATHSLWSPDHIRVEVVDAGPTAVGSRLQTVGYSVVAGRDAEAELEVTDLDRAGSRSSHGASARISRMSSRSPKAMAAL